MASAAAATHHGKGIVALRGDDAVEAPLPVVVLTVQDACRLLEPRLHHEVEEEEEETSRKG